MGRERQPTVTWSHVQGVCGGGWYVAEKKGRLCSPLGNGVLFSSPMSGRVVAPPTLRERALRSREKTGGWRQNERRVLKLQKGGYHPMVIQTEPGLHPVCLSVQMASPIQMGIWPCCCFASQIPNKGSSPSVPQSTGDSALAKVGWG